MVVSLTQTDGVAVVTIDNPPVNATSHAVRKALWTAIETTEANTDVRAVVLACAGRTFVAGADVSEFGRDPEEPTLPLLVRKLETVTKPWIAALHGTVLGGGLEIAMACRYRIAKPDTKLGFPEVNLGLIPGAGGTVQLPRLVPIDQALDLISSGKPISAEAALANGLLTEIATEDLGPTATRLASNAANKRLAPSVLERDIIAPADPDAFETKLTTIDRKAGPRLAPKAIVATIRNVQTLSVEDALAAERETFVALRKDPQSAALRHIFFAERATTRIPRIKGVAPLPFGKIGVIGGGTMGAGIAAACLLAGLTVTMVERDADAAQAGQERVATVLAGSLKRGLISADKHQAILAQFCAVDQYEALADAELVIEAVFEDMDVKKQVFAQLDAVTRPDAVLASNTSYLDLNVLAEATQYPSRIIGLHFFSPAHIMKLLEVVVPDALSDEALATGIAFAKALRKIPVLSGVCDGFIGNRIMSAYRRECEYMLEDGAMPWDIDAAMTEFGLPMGIFQMQDLAGLDISWAMRKRQAATRDPAQRYVAIGDLLCEMGRFGRKTGRGYYVYDDGKTGTPDPEVAALILAESERKSIIRRELGREDIMHRILAAMQAEGQKILDEGIAQSADDIDVVMVNAYGFPRWKGGPLFMAPQKG